MACYIKAAKKPAIKKTRFSAGFLQLITIFIWRRAEDSNPWRPGGFPNLSPAGFDFPSGQAFPAGRRNGAISAPGGLRQNDEVRFML